MGVAGTDEAAVAATPTLQFRILGPLEVSRDGAVVDVGARKQRAVLALLLLNANRVVSTERLIDELWGKSPPETARSALQVYVAALRKALGGDGSALRTSAPGYVLDVEPGALDLDRFVALRAESQAADDEERRSAAAARGARALARRAARRPLRRAVRRHGGRAARGAAARGARAADRRRPRARPSRVARSGARGARRTSTRYRERLRAQLMLALYRSGRQADALDAYQTARRTLDDELGLEPARRCASCEAAILRHDPRLSLDGSVGAGDRGGGRTPRAAAARSSCRPSSSPRPRWAPRCWFSYSATARRR